eukprot:190057-Chlamydomonas_euryale.AAC.4
MRAQRQAGGKPAGLGFGRQLRSSRSSGPLTPGCVELKSARLRETSATMHWQRAAPSRVTPAPPCAFNSERPAGGDQHCGAPFPWPTKSVRPSPPTPGLTWARSASAPGTPAASARCAAAGCTLAPGPETGAAHTPTRTRPGRARTRVARAEAARTPSRGASLTPA